MPGTSCVWFSGNTHMPADKKKKNGCLEWTLSNFAINAHKIAHKCKWSLRFWGQQQTGRLESSTMRSPFIMRIFRSLPRASTSSTLRYTISRFHAVCEHSLICFKCVDNHCCAIYVIKHFWHFSCFILLMNGIHQCLSEHIKGGAKNDSVEILEEPYRGCSSSKNK